MGNHLPGLTYKVPVGGKVTIPGPEVSPFYWHPDRVGRQIQVPDQFLARLQEVDPNLTITWNSYLERFQVWVRKPTIRTTSGWQLLFVVKYADGAYMPLDDRVFAALYQISGDKWGSGKKYFDHVIAEQERDLEQSRSRSSKASVDMAMDHFDFAQIKVSMAGPSNGSKFSTYHA